MKPSSTPAALPFWSRLHGGLDHVLTWLRIYALPGAVVGPLYADTYFRALVKNGACEQVYSATALVSVVPTQTLQSVYQIATVCEGSQAAIQVNGLIPGMTYTINYEIVTRIGTWMDTAAAR